MIFLPVAFYCTITSVCMFSQGQLTTEQQFKADGNIQAFQTTCIVLKPKEAKGTDI